MSKEEEKENLKKENKGNNSSDEEDKIDNEKFLKKEQEFKELLNKTKNNEDKTKIETNEVENFLLIKEIIQKVRNMKLDANELLKNKKYDKAIDKYKKAINNLIDEVGPYTLHIQILSSLKEEIIIPCYHNIALCYMKLSKWLKVKTYSKKILEIAPDNIKASYRICLANIKLGHLKKADSQLEELERIIGGTPELEELEKIYEINKLNSEGNNGEFLRKMGRKLRDGKINMYNDKKSQIEIEKEKEKNIGYFSRIKNYLRNLVTCCCKKKKHKKK